MKKASHRRVSLMLDPPVSEKGKPRCQKDPGSSDPNAGDLLKILPTGKFALGSAGEILLAGGER